MPKCHPLGIFDQMEAVTIANNPSELYNAILVDTPLGAFFRDSISEEEVPEMDPEIIRNVLYRTYLEKFYETLIKNIDKFIRQYHHFFSNL